MAVTLSALVLSAAVLSCLDRKIPVRGESAPIAESPAAPLVREQWAGFGLPVRLRIPKIGLDAAIRHVGLTPEGAVDVPKNQDEAAWFDLSPLPGERGSAIITGHYGWKGGKPSVFDDLHKLRKGDRVQVEDDGGMTVNFVMRENRRYDPDAEAPRVFDSGDDKAHLNLITCEGNWDEATGSYSKRLVIFTDRE